MDLIKKVFERKEFYMELDDAESPATSTPAATTVATSAPATATASAAPEEKSGGIFKMFGMGQKAEYAEPQDAGATATVQSTVSDPEPVQVAQTVIEPAPATTKTKKRSKNTQEKAVAASQPAAVEPITPQQPAVPQLTNFATDYLVNPRLNQSPRRRPGPSISPFKDMAKQIGRRSTSMG